MGKLGCRMLLSSRCHTFLRWLSQPCELFYMVVISGPGGFMSPRLDTHRSFVWVEGLPLGVMVKAQFWFLKASQATLTVPKFHAPILILDAPSEARSCVMPTPPVMSWYAGEAGEDQKTLVPQTWSSANLLSSDACPNFLYLAIGWISLAWRQCSLGHKTLPECGTRMGTS